MGYDLSHFCTVVDCEFCCSICSMVLENPVSTLCDHLFCRECISKWISSKGCCPVDREPQTIDDLSTLSRYFLNLLNKLKRKCDFYLQGCDEVVQLEHIESHHKSCKFNPIVEMLCDKGCNLIMCKREFDTHSCIKHLLGLVGDLEINVTKQDEKIISLQNRQHEGNVTIAFEITSLKLRIEALTDTMTHLKIPLLVRNKKWPSS